MAWYKDIIEGVLVEKYHNDIKLEKARIDKCNNCIYRVNDTCGVCGCFFEIKAKMEFNKNPKKLFRVEKTHCPEGFWDDKEIADYYKKL